MLNKVICGMAALLIAIVVGLGTYLHHNDYFRSQAAAGDPDAADYARLIFGKWEDQDGAVSEFTTDGRWSSLEVKKIDEKVVESRTTWGTYRFTAPRDFALTFRLESLASKPEFTRHLFIEEITEDRSVSKMKESGTTATSKRVKN
jgi:hypothetical protein